MSSVIGGLRSTAGEYSSDIQSAMGNLKALNSTINEMSSISKDLIDEADVLRGIIDKPSGAHAGPFRFKGQPGACDKEPQGCSQLR